MDDDLAREPDELGGILVGKPAQSIKQLPFMVA
jgi:hypothetical protein